MLWLFLFYERSRGYETKDQVLKTPKGRGQTMKPWNQSINLPSRGLKSVALSSVKCQDVEKKYDEISTSFRRKTTGKDRKREKKSREMSKAVLELEREVPRVLLRHDKS